ncbi:Precorrin-6A reductase [Planktothrix sp. PCC 11201]|uniref:cobalt-precorrin-6A reductase n=1 Tax=Planktothrix sp. PCC 11201 TaxID=1729650 RepID=UPI000920C3DF|nr:cobalt-precorrin-6A reductase [Planktothrix sp. PCC 11201]SKB13529.1 Precorrin-6A reductase [Planktothrix sp. PCC 11201]
MNHKKRVLILGGTTEAVAIATQINQIPGVEAIASLAGRTQQPVTQTNPVSFRIGGFGGIAGLANYLRQEHIDLVIDATHPFAAQISFNAAQAASECGIPRLMLIRPPWQEVLGDDWIEVDTNQLAAKTLPGLAERIFLTIGRQELPAYAHIKNIWFLMRMIDPPETDLPIPPGQLILQRGPFSLESERSLLQKYQIGAIVSKNSGGNATYAKIIAARELGLPVVMVKRPPVPEGETVTDVESVLSWVKNQ